MLERMKFAELAKERLEKVRALEDEIGTYVIALEPAYRIADLSEEKLKKLQALEKELGVTLLAYEK
jgi:hypothetical protein